MLLDEQRRAWAQRWERADVRIEGDDELQQAVRVPLFHLMAAAGDRGEAPVGARGLTGRAYRGHVFWDADLFVLPFLAATHPQSARAMLEYRIARLPAALARAAAEGRAGARFPWESADDGTEVTPHAGRDQSGRLVPIRTGDNEIHIVGDVVWAALYYAEWTGDEEFARRSGTSAPHRDGALLGVAHQGRLARTRAPLRRDRPRRVPRAGRRQRLHQRARAMEPAARGRHVRMRSETNR